MPPQGSTIFCGVSSLLVVLAMKVLIAFHRVSSHLIWLFKVWLILNFFQNLMHQLTEHCDDHLSSSRPRLPSKISLGPVIVVSVQPEISHILRDYLCLPFPLLLVLLNPLILVNMVHEPMHTSYRFLSQRLSQIMLGR